MREVLIVNGVRTAIGDYGGSLKNVPLADLGALVVREVIHRAGIAPEKVTHGVVGNVIHTEPRDMYISRVACIGGGMSYSSQALTVNRLCGSGLQAIVSAAQLIQTNNADITIGAGVESMSRGGYILPAARWGARMGDAKIMDMVVGALSDPFDSVHMGITAENVAEKWSISRTEQDEFAVTSHHRAAHAIAEGRFKEQIVDVEIKTRKKTEIFNQDEHVRADITVEKMGQLSAVFKSGGCVTAGNASGINDGAAAVLLVEAKTAEREHLKPMARLLSYGFSGVDPRYMGEGPIQAVNKALAAAGLTASQMDVIESNEAFAAQSLCVMKGLELDADKTNPNGGAVALGHPVGATGVILMTKTLYELQRIKGKYGLITMCIGGGQGIAAVIERL